MIVAAAVEVSVAIDIEQMTPWPCDTVGRNSPAMFPNSKLDCCGIIVPSVAATVASEAGAVSRDEQGSLIMTTLLDPMSFRRGPAMKNRFMLAPLTNSQSQEDGVLSDEECHWLTMRAQGGFGLTMTCAAHVQAIGKGFPGQLGAFGDEHLDGLARLAAGINAENSVSIVQLHHAGMRSPAELIGESPVCPSADEETGARALGHDAVLQLIDDFVAAAVRSERAGFDGVEIHGAHGHIVAQFLSPEIKQRDDEFGGSLENRPGCCSASSMASASSAVLTSSSAFGCHRNVSASNWPR